MDGSLPGSSTHGIFQASVPEWVAIAFSDYFILAIFLFIQKPLMITALESNYGEKNDIAAPFHSFMYGESNRYIKKLQCD